MNPSLQLPAFAKINLSLRVLGLRRDGYHELDTIFQTISLHDSIKFRATTDSEIRLTCDDRQLATDTQNLVMRAANALQQRFATPQGALIRLEKRIPSEAGLGGGSADAAVTLLALAQLWKLAADRRALLEIAANLGADVPFFFCGGTARGTGTGNTIARMPDAPEKFLLIIKPKAGISTADAYRALDERSLTSTNSKTILSSSHWAGSFDNAGLVTLENDFESVAFELEPEIARAKAALLGVGALAAMLAGSGSAVFGLFDSEDAQRRAIQALEIETGWRVFPCKMVGRDEYQNAFGDLRQLLT